MTPILATAFLPFAGLLQLLVVLIILGVVLYLVTTYIPMAAPVKTVITVLVVLALCLFLLRVAGLV